MVVEKIWINNLINKKHDFTIWAYMRMGKRRQRESNALYFKIMMPTENSLYMVMCYIAAYSLSHKTTNTMCSPSIPAGPKINCAFCLKPTPPPPVHFLPIRKRRGVITKRISAAARARSWTSQTSVVLEIRTHHFLVLGSNFQHLAPQLNFYKYKRDLRGEHRLFLHYLSGQ